MSGASGLIGSALVATLGAEGYRVCRLVRGGKAHARDDIEWDPLSGKLDANRLEEFQAVVHLAGRGIAQGRWTPRAKQEILRSRVDGTRLLAQALRSLARPPALLCASGLGYYGDCGDAELTESSPPGAGFLPEVARAWEGACAPAVEVGIRVVHMRFGVVLSAGGGALRKMLPAFRLGLGGRIGSGLQWMSWIALRDVVGAIRFLLSDSSLRGPVNVTSPQPLRNREFTRTLARVLRRPAVVPLPAAGVKLLLGQMGEEALLWSQRALPARLQAAGFRFQLPELEPALRATLGQDPER